MTMATLRVDTLGAVPIVYIEGEIDIVNASQVGGELFDAASNEAPGMVVDLSGVTYLDSRGLHLLFELAERLRIRDQRLHVAVPPRALIRRVLLLTHLDSVVPIYPTVQEAAQHLASAG